VNLLEIAVGDVVSKRGNAGRGENPDILDEKVKATGVTGSLGVGECRDIRRGFECEEIGLYLCSTERSL